MFMLIKNVLNDIEDLMEQDIHFLPCSYTIDVIELSPLQLRRHTEVKSDVIRTSFCKGT